MRKDKKAERDHANMLKWLSKHGKDTSAVEASIPAVKESVSETHLEGEAVLAYWESGRSWQHKVCRSCKQLFATNYNSTSTCSMKCLQQAVKECGFTWRPDKTAHERWGRTPPLVVPEAALIAIYSEPVSVQPLVSSDNSSELNHQQTVDFLDIPAF